MTSRWILGLTSLTVACGAAAQPSVKDATAHSEPAEVAAAATAAPRIS